MVVTITLMFINYNSISATTIKGTVPGGIYTDLRNAGILKDDIFFGDNDIKYRWVAKDDWTYSTTFQGN